MDREIEQLIDNFRRAAIEKGDFAEGRRDGQLYEIMRNSFHGIREFGEAGDEILVGMLDDESKHVRSWIAAALVVEGNLKARSVLEEIADTSSGMPRWDAETTLEEFRKGRLKTPFPNETR